MSANVRHSHETVEHYTPMWLVEAARQTFDGEIDLDPATSIKANEGRISAKWIITEMSAIDGLSGLTEPWNYRGSRRVFVNPPGSRVKGQRMGGQALWWKKACEELRNVEAIIFVSFSVELLQTVQQSGALNHPLDFTICFPRSRVKYDSPTPTGELAPGNSPPHSSMIICMSKCLFGKVPGVSAPEGYATRFARAFSPYGYIHDKRKCISC